MIYMKRFTLNELLSIAHRALFLISKNIYILYLGIISIIFSTVFSIFQFITPPKVSIPHNLTSNISSSSLEMLKWMFYFVNFIQHLSSSNLIIFIIIIVLYIVIAIYFTIAASSTIIQTLSDRKNWESKGNFKDYWRKGIKYWSNYFIYSILFGIMFFIVFLIFMVISTFLVSINSLFLILVLIFGIILLVYILSIAYIGIRLVLIEDMDIIDGIRYSFSLVKNNFSLFLNISLFYLVTLLILYLIANVIESVIISVLHSLYTSFGLTFTYPVIVIALLIIIFILGILAVYSSAFWTGVFIELRDDKKLFKIAHI